MKELILIVCLIIFAMQLAQLLSLTAAPVAIQVPDPMDQYHQNLLELTN